MKLKKPLKIRKNGEIIEVNEIEIKSEDFTGGVIIESERLFLYNQGMFPPNSMEESRDFLAHIACQILSCRMEDFRELPGEDFLKITNIIKNFYIGSDSLTAIMEKLLEERGVQISQKNVSVENS